MGDEVVGVVVGLDAKVTGLDRKVIGLDRKVIGLVAKVTGLVAKVTGLVAKVTGLVAKVIGLVAKVTGLVFDGRRGRPRRVVCPCRRSARWFSTLHGIVATVRLRGVRADEWPK
jgi:hypothetical protein